MRIIWFADHRLSYFKKFKIELFTNGINQWSANHMIRMWFAANIFLCEYFYSQRITCFANHANPSFAWFAKMRIMRIIWFAWFAKTRIMRIIWFAMIRMIRKLGYMRIIWFAKMRITMRITLSWKIILFPIFLIWVFFFHICKIKYRKLIIF